MSHMYPRVDTRLFGVTALPGLIFVLAERDGMPAWSPWRSKVIAPFDPFQRAAATAAGSLEYRVGVRATLPLEPWNCLALLERTARAGQHPLPQSR
jgi:hypothetical protein